MTELSVYLDGALCGTVEQSPSGTRTSSSNSPFALLEHVGSDVAEAVQIVGSNGQASDAW